MGRDEADFRAMGSCLGDSDEVCAGGGGKCRCQLWVATLGCATGLLGIMVGGGTRTADVLLVTKGTVGASNRGEEAIVLVAVGLIRESLLSILVVTSRRLPVQLVRSGIVVTFREIKLTADFGVLLLLVGSDTGEVASGLLVFVRVAVVTWLTVGGITRVEVVPGLHGRAAHVGRVGVVLHRGHRGKVVLLLRVGHVTFDG